MATDHQLPRFAAPRSGGYSLAIKPPFSFSGVNSLCFPLRASLDALQRFCDNYLNIVPPEIGRFRAPLPYVYLIMLDYGRMAIDVANVGWLSQREVCFCVSLEWYKVVRGKWVFYDWATICPFIYVDDDMSMTVGRGVYGWPKISARMTPQLSDWMTDPTSPIKEATLSTSVFPELYAGSRLEERIFLEVERQRAPTLGRLPLDMSTALAPWTIWSNIAESMNGFSRDYVGMMSGFGFLPMHSGSTGDNYLAMARRMVETAFPLQPNLSANTLNLKQFRRSESPREFAYQAITNGPMKYTQLNRLGPLGQERVALGDTSGGYAIKLHRWPSLPIIETLGLEVAQGWKGQDVDVAVLKPVLPFWYDVNMTYLPGYNVAWRSRDDVWHDTEGRAYPTGDESTALASLFNTTLGAGNKTVAGPFHFSDTTIRVLPLLARRLTLAGFVDGYLNDALRDGARQAGGCERRFSLWAPPGEATNDDFGYVYLTATSFGDVTSDTDNVGDWADVEVAFVVPVRYEERESGATEWTVKGVGVVPAFTYLDSNTAVAARSEVLGIPTSNATFINAESAWMTPNGAAEDARQTLLSVDAEVLPVVGEGQRALQRRILHIFEAAPTEVFQPIEWRNTADRWSAILKSELRRKRRTAARAVRRAGTAGAKCELDVACALALEPLANRIPLSLYTIKQFRDVADADRACYQSLVRVHRTLTDVYDLREIERSIMLHIHEFPTQPIVKLLGLVAREVDAEGPGVVYALQPIRPFYIRATMEESLGEMLCHRAGNGEWREPPPKTRPAFYFAGEPKHAASLAAVVAHDTGDPRRIALTDVPLGAEALRDLAQRISLADGRRAVHAIDPQMVIEALLSREWGNWSEEGRWYKRREELEAGLRISSEGMDARHQVELELAWLKQAMGDDKGTGSHLAAKTGEFLENVLTPLGEKSAAVESAWIELFDLMGQQKRHAENPTTVPPPNYGRVPVVLVALMTALHAISEDETFVGNPNGEEGSSEYMAAAKARRMREILDELATAAAKARAIGPNPKLAEIAEIAAVFWPLGDKVREAVALTRQRHRRQIDALLDMLARDAQKPDFVVPRNAGGPEADHVFPLDQSWDRHWFSGPPMADEQLENTMRQAAPAAGT